MTTPEQPSSPPPAATTPSVRHWSDGVTCPTCGKISRRPDAVGAICQTLYRQYGEGEGTAGCLSRRNLMDPVLATPQSA